MTIGGSVLRIVCRGRYGVGSKGNPSGALVKNAIESALDREGQRISQVVIDLRGVEYEWGDAPAWSVLPAVERGLKVRYVVAKGSSEAFLALISHTGFNELVETIVEESA